MWLKFSMDGYSVCAKQYEEGSSWGIAGGRISKLEMRKDGKIVVNYDRGWDIEPKNMADKTVLNKILVQYN